MRGYVRVTCGFGLACLLAFLAGTSADASASKRASFRVTLDATVTKDWNTVTDLTENGCPTSRRSIGHRTVRLHSTQPSTVVVTFGSGRVSYSPADVRFLSTEVKQSGSKTTTVQVPCRNGTVHTTCRRARRAVMGGRVRFYRRTRDEIAFRPTRLPDITSSCLTESAAVRAIKPGLQQAQGEISEATLADPGAPGQTGLGSSEVTTDLDGAEKGRIVERVHWGLTFTRIP
jgi:hypothetical protein